MPMKDVLFILKKVLILNVQKHELVYTYAVLKFFSIAIKWETFLTMCCSFLAQFHVYRGASCKYKTSHLVNLLPGIAIIQVVCLWLRYLKYVSKSWTVPTLYPVGVSHSGIPCYLLSPGTNSQVNNHQHRDVELLPDCRS